MAKDDQPLPRCHSWRNFGRLGIILLGFAALSVLLQCSGSFLPNQRFSSTGSQQERIGDDRPIAILHIGPRKTATTTIQYVLSQNKTRELLEQDSFVYIGKGQGFHHYNKVVKPFMNKCFGSKKLSSCSNFTVWQNFIKKMKEHRHKNENIIWSDEALPRLFLRNGNLQLLKEAFRGWNVKIAVSYRRYFEWIKSEYNQEQKYAHHIVPFVEWYGKHVNGSRSGQRMMRGNHLLHNKGSKHVIQEGRPFHFLPWDKSQEEHWRSYFSDIRVFNMRACQDKNHIKCFLCEMIPEAVELCKRLMEFSLVPDTHMQKSVDSIDAKIIVQAAMREHIVKGMREEWVVRAVRELMTSNASFPVPLECLSPDELQEILDTSLQMEKDLVPDFYSSEQGESALRSDYETAVADEKFCNPDVEQLLQEDAWLTFLKELKP